MVGEREAGTVASRLNEAAAFVKARATRAKRPSVGLILGSGLGAFAETLDGDRVAYADVPHMAASTIIGHAGRFVFGEVSGVPVVCMQGRLHLYEGHAPERAVLGARIMAKLGVESVLVTNAAGGLEPSWGVGALMMLSDHLNLTGASPLTGPNDESLGPRFPDMTYAYDPALRQVLREVARANAIEIREGVYAGLLGPTYETPAEIRMLKTLGAQAVGMSTVHEVIALRHMGVRVAALSCITNLGAGISAAPLRHDEVEEVARTKRGEMLALVNGFVARATEGGVAS